MCTARLTFGIDDRAMRGLVSEMNFLGIAVHPLDAVHFAPMQGPRPAECARDHDDDLHWDGHGTWWKGEL
jgi:hypothetical protein